MIRGEPPGRVGFQIGHGPLTDGLLDGLEYARDRVVRLSRLDDQVDVVGHEDEGPEGEVVRCPRLFDRVGKPLAGAFRGEEALSAIACECQFVSVAGLVELAAAVRSL